MVNDMGQQVGYIRVSSASQNTARQLQGVTLDRTFEERLSAKSIDRPVLEECLSYIRQGDTLHIHSLDRVCRSGAGDAVKLVEELTAKGVTVHFHKEGMVFNGSGMSAAQKGVLGILAAVAQMERELINERRIEGVQAARNAGKTFGRPKTEVTKDQIETLVAAGGKPKDNWEALGIGKATYYRVLKG